MVNEIKLKKLTNILKIFDNEYGTFLVEDCLDTIKEESYTLEDYIYTMINEWISEWINESNAQMDYDKTLDLESLQIELQTI